MKSSSNLLKAAQLVGAEPESYPSECSSKSILVNTIQLCTPAFPGFINVRDRWITSATNTKFLIKVVFFFVLHTDFHLSFILFLF